MNSPNQPPVAVVTGSSSGIGRATAMEFARRGYDVVLHARRNVTALQAVATDILERTDGGRVLCLTADISIAAHCCDLVQAAFHWQGHVDAWVNNAGADVLTTECREWSLEGKLQLLQAVDVMGTVRISRLVGNLMQQGRHLPEVLPSIINTGWDQSDHGFEGEAGQMFCTAKSAVMAFTRAYALTVSPHIRVNCVAPGWIQTAWGEGAASDYWDRRARGESLLERWGTPDDVASATGWLASEQAGFVNGQTIPVNGGRRFYCFDSTKKAAK